MFRPGEASEGTGRGVGSLGRALVCVAFRNWGVVLIMLKVYHGVVCSCSKCGISVCVGWEGGGGSFCLKT